MEKLFDMMAQWTPLGQALVLLAVISIICGTVSNVCYYATVSVRGWPPLDVEQEL